MRQGPAAGVTVAGEGLRFAIVGAGATLVSTTAFNLLVHWPPRGPSLLADRPLTAFALANLLGMVVSYTGSRSWAFRDRQAVGVGGGLPAFVAINIASWAVPLTCLAFTRYALGLDGPVADNVAANVVGLGLGMLVRFWALRGVVFRRPTTCRDVRRGFPLPRPHLRAAPASEGWFGVHRRGLTSVKIRYRVDVVVVVDIRPAWSRDLRDRPSSWPRPPCGPGASYTGALGTGASRPHEASTGRVRAVSEPGSTVYVTRRCSSSCGDTSASMPKTRLPTTGGRCACPPRCGR